MEENKQIREVDYDKELVEEYKKNYIMEEDGIGADEVGEVYDTQTTVNTDTIEELLGEGAEINELCEND